MSAESALDIGKNLFIFLGGDERDSLTLGFETTSSTDSVHVIFSNLRHIEIDNEVNSFDINTSTDQISSNQNSVLTFLEFLVNSGTVLLFEVTINEGVGMSLFRNELREIFSSILLVDEDDDLIVTDLVEELEQDRDLLLFFDLDVILFQTVQNELRVIFDEDFNLVL